MMEKLLTTEEVCHYLGKPRSWLYHEARNQGIPRHKIGNQWRYRADELDAWINDQVSS